MARVKSTSTPVKPILVGLFFLISLIVTFITYKWITVIRDQQVQTHTGQLVELANAFDLLELEYRIQFDAILSKRSPITELEVSLLTSKYEDLLKTAGTYDKDSQYLERIANRITDLHMLGNINSLLRTEHTIADSLDFYNSCKEKIAYKVSAAKTVQAQLMVCSNSLSLAVAESRTLPTYLFSSTCATDETPDYILQRVEASHNLLIEYYSLIAQRKGPQAAEVDKSYQELIKELQNAPKWNSCITEYIENQSNLFSSPPKE